MTARCLFLIRTGLLVPYPKSDSGRKEVEAPGRSPEEAKIGSHKAWSWRAEVNKTSGQQNKSRHKLESGQEEEESQSQPEWVKSSRMSLYLLDFDADFTFSL